MCDRHYEEFLCNNKRNLAAIAELLGVMSDKWHSL